MANRNKECAPLRDALNLRLAERERWRIVWPRLTATSFQDVDTSVTTYRDVFTRAAGEELYPSTLNVKIKGEIKIKEEFRIPGAAIGEPDQDLLFENCLINGTKAFRIRPLHLSTGEVGTEIQFLK